MLRAPYSHSLNCKGCLSQIRVARNKMQVLQHQYLTSAIFFPGLMSRMAASKAVLAAAMTSAALPVTAASSSVCTTNVCAAVATKPSMCDPRSLQCNHTLYVFCARKVLSNPLEANPQKQSLPLHTSGGFAAVLCSVLVYAPALEKLSLAMTIVGNPPVHIIPDCGRHNHGRIAGSHLHHIPVFQL